MGILPRRRTLPTRFYLTLRGSGMLFISFNVYVEVSDWSFIVWAGRVCRQAGAATVVYLRPGVGSVGDNAVPAVPRIRRSRHAHHPVPVEIHSGVVCGRLLPSVVVGYRTDDGTRVSHVIVVSWLRVSPAQLSREVFDFASCTAV